MHRSENKSQPVISVAVRMAYGLLYGMASRDIVLCSFLAAFLYSSFGKSRLIFPPSEGATDPPPPSALESEGEQKSRDRGTETSLNWPGYETKVTSF